MVGYISGLDLPQPILRYTRRSIEVSSRGNKRNRNGIEKKVYYRQLRRTCVQRQWYFRVAKRGVIKTRRVEINSEDSHRETDREGRRARSTYWAERDGSVSLSRQRILTHIVWIVHAASLLRAVDQVRVWEALSLGLVAQLSIRGISCRRSSGSMKNLPRKTSPPWFPVNSLRSGSNFEALFLGVAEMNHTRTKYGVCSLL